MNEEEKPEYGGLYPFIESGELHYFGRYTDAHPDAAECYIDPAMMTRSREAWVETGRLLGFPQPSQEEE